MQAKTLPAQARSNIGSKYTRRLRKTGLIPGVIYGHGEAPVSFAIDRHDLSVELQHGQRLLSLDLQGQVQSYLVKEVQFNHLGSEMLHIDLARVNLDELVTVAVAIELRGAPKGVGEGGVLEQIITEIEVQCLASNIPNNIRVSAAHLNVGESLTVGQLELPPGVKTKVDPSAVIATVRVVAEEIAPAVTEAAEAVEPEVITKRKTEEEEEPQEK